MRRKTIQGIDIQSAIDQVQQAIQDNPDMPASQRLAMELLLLVVTLLWGRLNTNSKNSNLPPSQDPNREKKSRAKNKRRPGGQPGHIGTTLEPVAEPDEIQEIPHDRKTLPKQGQYRHAGFEKRQVVEVEFSRVVVEYRAEVLEDEQGQRYVAPFPPEVTRPIQYGKSIKAHAVYLSQHQLLPYERIQEYFSDQLGIPLSAGSLFRFNQEAYAKAEAFETWVKEKLKASQVANADETGINISRKNHWLHCVSNEQYTLLVPHASRGKKATDEIGVLPRFDGVLCHDHWKSYFSYGCKHSLCNAHHLRELDRAYEQDGQKWALKMAQLLTEILKKTKEEGGFLPPDEVEDFKLRYRKCLEEAEEECPPLENPPDSVKRGRKKQTKSRNLLERLRDFEKETLRFMEEESVPFTNNQAENDLRMSKVQQKISGCFRSFEGAQIFARMRSYLVTARKQGMRPLEALTCLFDGKVPEFMQLLQKQNKSSEVQGTE